MMDLVFRKMKRTKAEQRTEEKVVEAEKGKGKILCGFQRGNETGSEWSEGASRRLNNYS